MSNLLGGLIEETEANMFKVQLVEDSDITYSKGVKSDFEDKFEYTEESVKDLSTKKLIKK